MSKGAWSNPKRRNSSKSCSSRLSELKKKRQLLNFVFQNFELKDKKLSITLRESFKMIKDTSLAGKRPEICRSQDSFRTFKEFH
jgi:hypothetical protein